MPNIENKFWSLYETCKSIGEIKLMKLFLWLHNFLSSYRKLFWCYFRQLFIVTLDFRQCKRDLNMLNIILLKDFCPLKTEINLFPIRFHLNLYLLAKTSPSSIHQAQQNEEIKRNEVTIMVAKPVCWSPKMKCKSHWRPYPSQFRALIKQSLFMDEQ